MKKQRPSIQFSYWNAYFSLVLLYCEFRHYLLKFAFQAWSNLKFQSHHVSFGFIWKVNDIINPHRFTCHLTQVLLKASQFLANGSYDYRGVVSCLKSECYQKLLICGPQHWTKIEERWVLSSALPLNYYVTFMKLLDRLSTLVDLFKCILRSTTATCYIIASKYYYPGNLIKLSNWNQNLSWGGS